MADQGEGSVGRWARRHKYLSAAVLIGVISFVCFVVGGAAAGLDSLNHVAGAVALILLLGLIVYVSLSVVRGLRDGIAMVSPVIYALAAFAMFLLGLFVLIWIIKRMWEAA